MDYKELEFLYDVDGVYLDKAHLINLKKYKVKDMPSVDLYVDIESNEIIEVEIDEDYNFEVDWSIIHWWSDWSGEDVGRDDVLIVGYYALKDFPNVEIYIDVENERILEAWLVEDEI